jgi:hypothetical protein
MADSLDQEKMSGALSILEVQCLVAPIARGLANLLGIDTNHCPHHLYLHHLRHHADAENNDTTQAHFGSGCFCRVRIFGACGVTL